MAEAKVTNSPEKTNPPLLESEKNETRRIIEDATHRLTFLLETFPFVYPSPECRAAIRNCKFVTEGPDWDFFSEGIFSVLHALEKLYWKIEPDNDTSWIGSRPSKRSPFNYWSVPGDLQGFMWRPLVFLAFVQEKVCTYANSEEKLSDGGLLGLRGWIEAARDGLFECVNIIDYGSYEKAVESSSQVAVVAEMPAGA